MTNASQFAAPEIEQNLETRSVFDDIAQSYDVIPNPLLALEQRYLERLLPDLSARDVVDVGCGSGRWLSALSRRQPRSLKGLDPSIQMLDIAQRRGLPSVELLRSSCTGTGLPDQSADLMLCSFVLSHVSDLRRAAVELTRVARPGCDLFVSDMHPETQEQLGWRRAFRDGSSVVECETFARVPSQLAAVFDELGWNLSVAIEAEFGPPEMPIFEAAGRLHRFHEAEGRPAIYLIHLRRRDAGFTTPEDTLFLKRASCAIGPEESVRASVRVADGVIVQIAKEYSSTTRGSSSREVDLAGYRLMPGLVNAHDHLEFALFPRLGNPPYANASAWASDIQQNFASTIQMHKAVQKEVRLWWGGIRNLLCGATTVCHHNPLEPELEREDFPVRVVRDCGWAHSIAFGGDLQVAKKATAIGRPFILHACEGIDPDSYAEVHTLDAMSLIDENCVLVHGLAIDESGAMLIRRRGASVILCPSSNQYLFGAVPKMSRLEQIPHLALGSDSPLTAAGDFLDEIGFAIGNCGIAPERAYRMATETPASILRIHGGEGTMRCGARADLIAVRDAPCSPARALGSLSVADIELVLVGGQVRLASREMLNRLPASITEGLEPLWVDGAIRWLRAPIQRLLEQAERVLGRGAVRLGGRPIRLATQEEVADAH